MIVVLAFVHFLPLFLSSGVFSPIDEHELKQNDQAVECVAISFLWFEQFARGRLWSKGPP